MLVSTAASLLAPLARGEAFTLPSSHGALLLEAAALGLVARAPDTSAARAELARLRALLVAEDTPDAERTRLRAQLLQVADEAAKDEGAVAITLEDTSAYRETATARTERWLLTQPGRALLADIAPRLGRASELTTTAFEAEMQLLRSVLAARADRAQTILAQLLGTKFPHTAPSASALRSVAIGLAARAEEPEAIVATFVRTLTTLHALADGGVTPDQDAAAAESLVLGAPTLASLSRDAIHAYRVRRTMLAAGPAKGQLEDALDAAVLLGRDAAPAATAASLVQRATELVVLGASISLTEALVLEGAAVPFDRVVELTRLLRARALVAPPSALAKRAPSPGAEHRIAPTPLDHDPGARAAVLLALAGPAALAALERATQLHSYLARFGHDDSLTLPALLALLPIEVPEALDLLRMASSALSRARFQAGGPEALALAGKLLLQTALLALGDEGDPEERAAFVRFESLAFAHLGFAGLATHLPLRLTVLTAFHRPALQSALEVQAALQPMHSSYVFGSSSRGWG